MRELCSNGDGLPDTLVDSLTELSQKRKIVRKPPKFSATEEGIMKSLKGSERKEKVRLLSLLVASHKARRLEDTPPKVRSKCISKGKTACIVAWNRCCGSSAR